MSAADPTTPALVALVTTGRARVDVDTSVSEHVRNDDRSWTEHGSLVGAPIETGDGSAN